MPPTPCTTAPTHPGPERVPLLPSTAVPSLTISSRCLCCMPATCRMTPRHTSWARAGWTALGITATNREAGSEEMLGAESALHHTLHGTLWPARCHLQVWGSSSLPTPPPPQPLLPHSLTWPPSPSAPPPSGRPCPGPVTGVPPAWLPAPAWWPSQEAEPGQPERQAEHRQGPGMCNLSGGDCSGEDADSVVPDVRVAD
jgi:hypothetical protein